MAAHPHAGGRLTFFLPSLPPFFFVPSLLPSFLHSLLPSFVPFFVLSFFTLFPSVLSLSPAFSRFLFALRFPFSAAWSLAYISRGVNSSSCTNFESILHNREKLPMVQLSDRTPLNPLCSDKKSPPSSPISLFLYQSHCYSPSPNSPSTIHFFPITIPQTLADKKAFFVGASLILCVSRISTLFFLRAFFLGDRRFRLTRTNQ